MVVFEKFRMGYEISLGTPHVITKPQEGAQRHYETPRGSTTCRSLANRTATLIYIMGV